MDKYFKEALDSGFIPSSTSPAGAGFFFVEKKDGSLRPYTDYRGSDHITIKNRYPLPLMTAAFEILQGATIFTKLDLRNAYHLVRIREGDEWKTAFNTPTGHYEYQVMPFGLVNAPAVFQAFINALREMLNIFVFVNLDDILKFYLTSVKQVQRFLGFSNFFRRFIRNLISVAEPLSALTKKSAKPFVWTSRPNQAFNRLKQLFTSAPILTLSDPEMPFVLEVDVSDVGVGAVLSQRTRSDNKLHPCAFFPVGLPQLREIMIMGTGSCWPIKWHWKSGGIGWRGPNTLSSYGRTTEASLASGRRRG